MTYIEKHNITVMIKNSHKRLNMKKIV